MQTKTIGHSVDRQVSYSYPPDICCGCGRTTTSSRPIQNKYQNRTVSLSLPLCEQCQRDENQRQTIESRVKKRKDIFEILLGLLYLGGPFLFAWLFSLFLDTSFWIWLAAVVITLPILLTLINWIGKRMDFTPSRWKKAHPTWPIHAPIASIYLLGPDLYLDCQDVYGDILDMLRTTSPAS